MINADFCIPFGCSPNCIFVLGMNEALSNKEIEALIHLLDDTDEEVYSHVKERIIDLGEPVIPQLEEAWEHSFNHLLQERIEDVIHVIQFDGLAARLAKWKEEGELDLWEGVVLIARYQYPDLDEPDLRRQLELIRRDVEKELKPGMKPLEKVRVINHVLFDIYGFTSNKTHFHSPPNNYINNVLESRKGNPLSLSVVFAVLAQSLGMPVYGVNLPEHFILAYMNTNREEPVPAEQVLFYVNPFSKGAIFSKREIDTFLNQLKIAHRPEFYEPCSNARILQRMLNNLIFAYEGMGYKYKVEELKELRQIVS